MSERYNRNRIYIDEQEQAIIKGIPIVVGGSGIGSVVAECALRLGFENITVIDGDSVEQSNLNRQNYTESDIVKEKVFAIQSRLRAINKDAIINVHNCYITEKNIEEFVRGHKVAINALDFSSDIPFRFDQVCKAHGIPVLHPYNLGWGGLAIVVDPEGMSLAGITDGDERRLNELAVAEYVSDRLKHRRTPQYWLDEVIEKYLQEEEQLCPPQLSIASWAVASMCTHILFNLATKKKVKVCPEFYFSTLTHY